MLQASDPAQRANGRLIAGLATKARGNRLIFVDARRREDDVRGLLAQA